MTEKEVFETVLDELMNCDLFTGKYDARNGNEHFMNGIATVMEFIAYRAGDDVGDAFSDLFTKNLIESEEKVKTFDIDFSTTVHVKAKTVEEAYDKFYEWLDEIPKTKEVQVYSVCVNDDQLRPEEDLMVEWAGGRFSRSFGPGRIFFKKVLTLFLLCAIITIEIKKGNKNNDGFK